MDREEDEIIAQFFTLLTKVKDVLVVNRPDLIKYIKMTDFRDPFGKYFQILLYIGSHHRVSMKEFAYHFNLKPGTATGVIDQLVNKKLLSRETNTTDRRKVELILTDIGREIYEKIVQIQKDEIRTVLDALSQQDKENAKNLLVKINRALIIKERK